MSPLSQPGSNYEKFFFETNFKTSRFELKCYLTNNSRKIVEEYKQRRHSEKYFNFIIFTCEFSHLETGNVLSGLC